MASLHRYAHIIFNTLNLKLVSNFTKDFLVSSKNTALCLLDPHGIANKWIKNMERANQLLVIKFPEKRTLAEAIRLGRPVLLEDIEEEIDPILHPLLDKATIQQHGVAHIEFGQLLFI